MLFELEKRCERVVIEQIKALTADETEMVATSLIDLDFATREQERFAAGARNDRNLKARAVALGVRLEELRGDTVTSILSESDVVLEDALAPENRSALVRQLATDYSANKKG